MHGPIFPVENTKNLKKISVKNICKLSVKYAVLSDQGKVHDSSKCKIHSEECIVKTAWFLLEVCIFDF